MKAKNPEKDFSDEETARRRDELAKRMLNMSPKPLKQLGKTKPKVGASPKKRGTAMDVAATTRGKK